jgi:hypothetical protein
VSAAGLTRPLGAMPWVEQDLEGDKRPDQNDKDSLHVTANKNGSIRWEEAYVAFVHSPRSPLSHKICPCVADVPPFRALGSGLCCFVIGICMTVCTIRHIWLRASAFGSMRAKTNSRYSPQPAARSPQPAIQSRATEGGSGERLALWFLRSDLLHFAANFTRHRRCC